MTDRYLEAQTLELNAAMSEFAWRSTADQVTARYAPQDREGSRLALRWYALATAAYVDITIGDGLPPEQVNRLNTTFNQGLAESSAHHNRPAVAAIERGSAAWSAYYLHLNLLVGMDESAVLPEGPPGHDPLLFLAYLQEGRLFFTDISRKEQPAHGGNARRRQRSWEGPFAVAAPGSHYTRPRRAKPAA
jgi:hypothetical protein